MTARKKIKVAISGLNAVDSPGPGVAVARCLKESSRYDVTVIGLAYENLEPGIYLDLVDKSYQIPYPSSGSQTLLNRLSYIIEAEKPDIIIPNFDAELPNFIRIASSLESLGPKLCIPSEQGFKEREKDVLEDYGKKYDIPVPKSLLVTSIAELDTACKKIGFPLLVKGRFYEAFTVHSLEQAIACFHKMLNKWGTPVVVQKFILGEEFNLCAVGDGQGNLVGAVSMKKLFITDAGKAWAGISIFDDYLQDLAKKIIQKTQWRGGMEIEMIKPIDKEPIVIEINPRFPAWVYLTSQCGMNLPERLIDIALGKKPDTSMEYSTGKVFIRYAYDMVIDFDRFHQFSKDGEI